LGYFFKEGADARAILTLWNTRLEDAPRYLVGDELAQYAQGWLMAQTVKVDLFVLLQKIWDAVWQSPGWSVLKPEDYAGDENYFSRAAIAWVTDGDDLGNHCAYSVLKREKVEPGRKVSAAVGLDVRGSLSLWAWHEAMANKDPVAGWRKFDGDGGQFVADVGEITTAKLDLANARRQALALLKAADNV
jgi:hypothetical protein